MDKKDKQRDREEENNITKFAETALRYANDNYTNAHTEQQAINFAPKLINFPKDTHVCKHAQTNTFIFIGVHAWVSSSIIHISRGGLFISGIVRRQAPGSPQSPGGPAP